MSNLNSVFDTLRGWPDGSALENSFEPDPNVTSIPEGSVVQSASRELAAAAVLKIVDDSLVTAPTLVAADAGKAYHVAGVGGVWSVFDIGDIVEWSGTAWVLALAGSGGTPVGPPDGTRAVVVSASAAGSFSGEEEKVMAFTTGAPGAWAVADTPLNKNRILIDATAGLYDGIYYEYIGTHPAGSWSQPLQQTVAPAMVAKLTSAEAAAAVRDHAWLVIQGNDQSDAAFVNRVTCIKCHTGFVAKVQSDIANTLAPGDFVHAVAGVLTKTVAGGGMKWPIGLVIGSNATAGSTGWVIIAS